MKILFQIFLLTTLLAGCRSGDTGNAGGSDTSQTPLQRLLAGNERFNHLQPRHPDEDLRHRLEEAEQQHPFAVVVTCSDSRVAPELIFDQGIGDLFVIRTAGNIIGDVELGSIEYAVEHLDVQLVVVMGHENCGAVKAFVEGGEAPGHIRAIIDSLRMEKEIRAIPLSDEHRLDHCITANVQHGVRQLRQAPLLQAKTR
ncbi:MAG TPA: carbonic anhydrase [Lacibacter sp.]|nr:carbonic anhydrase [Lacibacter sp.]HMO90532.1 carbonic anhydrase [Lacibacter sp.]HMP87438.1 carbonic anhydrase [Lacibacter sp.]